MAFAAIVMAACLFDNQIGRLSVTVSFAILALLRLTRGPAVLAPPSTAMALFAIGVSAAAFGASPLALGGVHPLWALVGPGGAAAIDLEGEWLGLLDLLSLGLAFWLAFQSGAQLKTARSLIKVMMAVGLVLEIFALGAYTTSLLWAPTDILSFLPLYADPGFRGAAAGVLIILSCESLLQGMRAGSAPPGGSLRRLLATPLSLGCAAVSLICLITITTLPVAAIALTLVVLQMSWSFLLGQRYAAPRPLLLWLAPGAAVLAAVVAMLLASWVSPVPQTLLTQDRSWTAIWASPWLGYGLGSEGEVARLFMTRLSAGAAGASSAYSALVEQGGFLTCVPLLAAIAWITGSLLFISIRRSGASSMMRAIVCASLFLALLGIVSRATADYSIAAIWTALLGLGAGAAHSSYAGRAQA